MYRVALTGLIGAGKSTAALVFRTLGIPCYDTDSNARRLMAGALRTDVSGLLGNGAFLPDGRLDKAYIGRMIFSDAETRDRLNAIVHPAVKRDFAAWSERQMAPYTLAETALLLESGFTDAVDSVIVVTADAQERMERTMARDGMDGNAALRRIRAQKNEEEVIAAADWLVDNSERTLMIPRILEIHKIILSLSLQKNTEER